MQAFIGSIILFAGDYPPKGWAYCNGRLLDVTPNSVLYLIIGHKYGGISGKSFALPTISDVGQAKYIIAVDGIYPPRD